MTKYTPWSRLLSTDRGNESIQTVTILAVAATVLIGLLNVGRTVRDRGREKVEAVLAGGPSASARPPEYDTATAAEIPGAEVAPTVAFGSRNSVTDAGDSRRSASAFDTAAPTGGTPATSPLVKPTPGNNPGTTNPKPSGPQIDPPPVKEPGEPASGGKQPGKGKIKPVDPSEADPGTEDPFNEDPRENKLANKKSKRSSSAQADDGFEGPSGGMTGGGGQSGNSGGSGSFGGGGFPGSGGLGNQNSGFGNQYGYPQNGQYGGGAPGNGYPNNGYPGNGSGFGNANQNSDDRDTDDVAKRKNRSADESSDTDEEAESEDSAAKQSTGKQKRSTTATPSGADSDPPAAKPSSLLGTISGLFSGNKQDVSDVDALEDRPVDAPGEETSSDDEGLFDVVDEDSEPESDEESLPAERDADPDEINIVGIDRKEPRTPRLIVNVGKDFDQIQVRIGKVHRAFNAPPAGSISTIPMPAGLLQPGSKIVVLGITGENQLVMHYEVPYASPPQTEMAVTKDDPLPPKFGEQ